MSLPLLLAQTTLPESSPTAPDLPWIIGMLVLGMAVAVGFFWVLTQLSRKPPAHVDSKGLRTHATVRVAGAASLEELLLALRSQLVQQGVTVGGSEAAADALDVPMEVRHAQFAVRLGRAGELVSVAVLDRGAANRPLAEARQAPLDSTPLRRLLDALDRALRQLPQGSDVRWHKHEKWLAGERGDGAHEPIER